MSWKDTAAHNAARLQRVIKVEQYARHLCELPQPHAVGMGLAQLEGLKEKSAQAERQRQRLEKGEFRIAVVGMEKAGKSSFVNAWLDNDLLPTRSTRCTFTTTQIFSENESQQRLEIRPKTLSQFQRLVSELERKAEADNGADEARTRAKADLEAVQRNISSLREVLEKGDYDIKFIALDDIKEKLRTYVADERYAHAMQEVRLRTCRLAKVDGIVFYDVPGLDSGLGKHVEESRDMLHDCDAVILVQRFPTLRASEQELVKYAVEGDPYIELARKLFVFFGFIDTSGTQQGFLHNYAEAKKEWHSKAHLGEERIFPGSAGAYLVLNGLAGDDTLKNVGNQETVIANMRRVTGKDGAGLNELKDLTGIRQIREAIFSYLDTERVDIVEKRCGALCDDILGEADKIYQRIRDIYPEDPEQARAQHDRGRNIKFNQWLAKRLNAIESDVNKEYTAQFSGGLSEQSMENFLAEYRKLVAAGMGSLPARSAKGREQVFYRAMTVGVDRAEVNSLWRKELYLQIRDMIDKVSEDLAVGLDKDIKAFSDHLCGKLWGIQDAKKELLKKDQKAFLDDLKHSFKVLFLRFARPLLEALVRSPVNSDTRINIVELNDIDLETLDAYYSSSGEVVYKDLKRFLRYGVKLLIDPDTIKLVFGLNIDGLRTQLEAAVGTLTDNPGQSQWLEVIREVEADLMAFEYYLLNCMYDAAGFKAFCQQEMENLRVEFLKLLHDGSFAGIVQNEWKKGGNDKLLAELPPDLSTQDFNTDVSERLRALGDALREARRN